VERRLEDPGARVGAECLRRGRHRGATVGRRLSRCQSRLPGPLGACDGTIGAPRASEGQVV
jgi:hypothetical protein